MKYPLKHKIHDLATNMRGQGKRTGGMVKGAMAARTGVSLEIDVRATYGLDEREAEEVELLGDWGFRSYHRLRNDGISHENAILYVYEEEERRDGQGPH